MSLFTDIIQRINTEPKKAPQPLPETKSGFDEPIYKQDQQHPSIAYMYLKRKFRDLGRMNAIIETLGRDFLTAMPNGAYQSRLGQISFMHRLMHEDLTEEETQRWLDRARDHQYKSPDDWDEWDTANLNEMTNMYLMFTNVDPDLIEDKARLSYEGRNHHRALKETGDWEQAKGFLSAQIDLNRKIADARCKTLGVDSHYQMLMQEFMPGMTIYDTELLFNSHEDALNKIYPLIQAKQASESPPIEIDAKYDSESQMWLNRSLLEVIGFDFERGGLYETGHNPVEGGTVDDTRLVISNVDETNFLNSMKSALHEGGHGIYIQGLPRQSWRYQPVAMDLGAAVHESQALLIEMILGRTPEFFEFLSPRLEGLFHGMNNQALSPENLYKRKTRIKPGVDRKKADEVTYFFHVNLRFKLERDLIDGSLSINDLPEAWVEGMHASLGVLPENHLDGCLQDVHWFVGKFGYFPAYALGHMMAAQFHNTMKKEIPDMSEQISEGDFSQIQGWLNENIYRHGRLMSTKEMLKKATGKELRAEYLEKHLRKRYLD
ncbi:MAG: carboxypeptidase M32 [Alphaproteobacteria bacterium]|nr:carboxypeptidase M32 [Alphaproteobacteria bacterium]